MHKIAFLLFWPLRPPRQSGKFFDNFGNCGISLLKTELNKHNIEVGYCSVDSAKDYDIVLISLTSPIDVLALYSHVKNHPDWQPGKRKFKSIAGGFGVQNPIILFDYVDYFWYGRAEDHIVQLVTKLGDYDAPYLLEAHRIRPVKTCPATKLYGEYVIFRPGGRKVKKVETSIGCKNKCYYCVYSWNRNFLSEYKVYYQDISCDAKTSISIAPNQLPDEILPRVSHFIMGCDGISERLRRGFNRPITNEQLLNAFEFCAKMSTPKAIKIELYNIHNLETENDADFDEFEELIMRAHDKIKNYNKKVVILFKNTLLTPSINTPSAYCKLTPTCGLRVNKRLMNLYYKTRNNTTGVLFTNSPLWQTEMPRVEFLVVSRYQEKFRPLVDLLVSKKFRKLKTAQQWFYISNKFDLTDLYREYDINEDIPSWFVEGIASSEVVKNNRKRMKRLLYGNG